MAESASHKEDITDCRSCRRCRLKKVRCDGGKPHCGYCTLQQQQCVYPPDARYRQSAAERPPGLGLFALSQRSNIISNHNPTEATPDSHIPSPVEVSLGVGKHGINQAERHVNSNPDTGPSSRSADFIPSSATTISLESHMPESDDIEGDASSSGVGILSSLHRAFNYAEGPKNASHDADDETTKEKLMSYSAMWRQQETLILQPNTVDKVDFDGLSPEMATHLIDLYWNNQHMIWLIAYRPAIMESLLQGGQYMNKLLLNAFYLCGSLLSDRPGVRFVEGDYGTFGMSFYARIRQLLVNEIGKSSIPTTVALLLCGVSLVSLGMTGEGWASCDLAHRMLADSDRHSEQFLTHVEVEMRNRLRMGAFSINMALALYVGCTPFTELRDLQEQANVLDTYEELEMWPSQSPWIDPSGNSSSQDFQQTPTHTISTFVAHVQLMQIASDALQSLYHEDSEPVGLIFYLQKQSAIEQRLTHWLQSLPNHLHFDLDIDPLPLPHQTTLLLVFHAVKLLTLRPLLERPGLRCCLDSVDRTTAENACVEEAVAIWRLLSRYRERFTLRRSSILLSFSGYVAIMTMLDNSAAVQTGSTLPISSLWFMMLEMKNGPNPGLQKPLTNVRVKLAHFYSGCAAHSDVGSQESTFNEVIQGHAMIDDTSHDDPQGTAATIASPLDLLLIHKSPEQSADVRQAQSVGRHMSTTDNPQPSADDEAYKLVSRFINIQTPGTTTGSPRWLQAAGLIAETCPLLRDVLEATSRLFLAKTIKDTEIELDAQQRYGSVLSRVQSSLRQPDESSSTWLLLSIAVVTIFEMLQQRSENPIVCHWGALLTLIEKRGPLRHVHGIERCFFIELRLLWVLWSVEFRRPTFLSLEEWRTIPWTQTDVQKDALQHLLDTVLEIPAFLRQCDRYTEMSNDPSIPAQESTLMMRSMQSWAFILRNRLQQWKGDYADDYPAGQPYECNQNDTLPIFQCWNRERDIVITPTAFMYPDLVLATSLCIYKAILLSLSNEVVSADFITQTKKYSYACDICRSIQFYLQANHGNVTMQILYPLRIAYQVFEERSIERQFVEDISEFIVKQYHFEAFPSLVTATTPPDNSVLNQQI